jgi:polyisoprenyl-phosphate glycosyltransferase
LKSNPIEISVVVPIYNEQESIDCFFERIESTLGALKMQYEVICVNDGSTDETINYLLRHHQRNSSIKVINLSRNFGKEIALTVGIDFASGAAVVPIDADLQDPPELIPEMVDKWLQGYDVVLATRRNRHGEGWVKKLTAHLFYKVISLVSPIAIPENTGDFRLLDRRVVEALKKMPEQTRFMKGLFAWVGFRQASIFYDREPRYSGKTKWNYWRLWNLAMDGITSFSAVPLRIWSYVGLLISLPTFLYAVFLIIRNLVHGADVPGYTSLMVVILFLGGVQLLSLGVIGDYLSRVYEESKRRPLYFIRDCYGIRDEKDKTS